MSPEFTEEFHSNLMSLMGHFSGAQAQLTMTGGAGGGFRPPALSEDEALASTTDTLLKEMDNAQAAHAEQERKRREAQKGVLERRRTEMKSNSEKRVKEHLKLRLEGHGTDNPNKVRAQKSSVKKVFESIDKNKDDHISVEEFEHLLGLLGLNWNAEMVQENYARLHADNSGGVDFNAFFEWYSGSN
jgi:hypothetical protein